jgi:hypothetical protein
MHKSHLYFRNPQEGIVEFKQRPGGFNNTGEEEEKNYLPMADNLRQSINSFYSSQKIRHQNRTLDLPVHFDMIEITFQGSFNQPKFEGSYFTSFGLSLVNLSKFNRKGLFVIEDIDKFNHFFKELNQFIHEAESEQDFSCDQKILFIKDFKLYSSYEMWGNIDNFMVIHLSLIDIKDKLLSPQKEALKDFLNKQNILFEEQGDIFEIYETSDQTLNEILNNFDIIYQSCSGSGAIIEPDTYNTPKRTYGFEITNDPAELPIIGIIDTGISNNTPLEPLLIDAGDQYDLTDTGLFVDNADHGTGVASFAALGNKPIPGYKGSFEADARLLPIKILDGREGGISQSKIAELIRSAHIEYGVKIFTLTIGYASFPMKDNEEFSSYARMLDQLANDLNILIFISTSNNLTRIKDDEDYPNLFKQKSANLAAPAESMNNITIGAIANNYENNNQHIPLSPDKSLPAIYSRKFHYNFDDDEIFSEKSSNKRLRKPDVLMPGGDYERYDNFGIGYDEGGETALEVLSGHMNERTYKGLGTSYSAPLVANLAARIMRYYPSLTTQSIKALLINASRIPNTASYFSNFTKNMKYRINGYGVPDENIALSSSEDKATFVIEDMIRPGYIKSYPIYLPGYLNIAGRKNALLRISATLCFSFLPNHHNQLTYCPIHLSFIIGKNLQLEKNEMQEKQDDSGKIRLKNTPVGYNANSATNLKLSNDGSWAQDYYLRNKIFSNTQKVNFNVSRDKIINEGNCFKIAVNSAFHKQLTKAEQEPYLNKNIQYSLIINIEQNPLAGETLDSLYDELLAINDLEAITEIDLDAELNY